MTDDFVAAVAGPPPVPHAVAIAALDVAIDAAGWGWAQGRAVDVVDGVRCRCASQLLSDAAIASPGLCSWLHVVAHAVLVERAALAAGLDPVDLPADLPTARAAAAAACGAAGLARPEFGLPSWNDAPGRVAAEVAELFGEVRFRVRVLAREWTPSSMTPPPLDADQVEWLFEPVPPGTDHSPIDLSSAGPSPTGG